MERNKVLLFAIDGGYVGALTTWKINYQVQQWVDLHTVPVLSPYSNTLEALQVLQ